MRSPISKPNFGEYYIPIRFFKLKQQSINWASQSLFNTVLPFATLRFLVNRTLLQKNGRNYMCHYITEKAEKIER